MNKEAFCLKRSAIIEKLAKDIDLCRHFSDIRVLEEKADVLAYTDIGAKVLYINAEQTFISFADLVKGLCGLVVHEFGHIDKRLKVPATRRYHFHVIKKLKRKKDFDKDLLNLLYDLEIHYQYLMKRMIKPSKRRMLNQLNIILRNRVFEKDKGSMVISFEYQLNDLQRFVRKLVENRDIDVAEKYKRLAKFLKKNQKKGLRPSKPLTLVVGDEEMDESEKGTRAGKGKKKAEQMTLKKKEKKKSFAENSVSIKKLIFEEREKSELKEKLSVMGFSADEINELCRKYNADELVENITNLENSLRDIIPQLNGEEGRQKTRSHLHSKGDRLNGYHKLKDFDEITENVEDLMTVGVYDLDEMSIPTRVRRKIKGAVILLRDVSGSVSSFPLNKMVRDITATLVRIAKRKQLRIGIADFHSVVEPIRDRKGRFITTDYNMVLFESMRFKDGFSTVLSKAIRFVSRELKREGLDRDNVNLFIVTDSYTDDASGEKMAGKNVNVVGIWCRHNEFASLDRAFKRTIEAYNGKIYEVSKTGKGLVAKLYQEVQEV